MVLHEIRQEAHEVSAVAFRRLHGRWCDVPWLRRF